MNNRQLKSKLKEVLVKTLEEQASKNLPFVYRDKSCVTKSQFIHLYPNGNKVLIQQDRNNSTEKVIKVF